MVAFDFAEVAFVLSLSLRTLNVLTCQAAIKTLLKIGGVGIRKFERPTPAERGSTQEAPNGVSHLEATERLQRLRGIAQTRSTSTWPRFSSSARWIVEHKALFVRAEAHVRRFFGRDAFHRVPNISGANKWDAVERVPTSADRCAPAETLWDFFVVSIRTGSRVCP